MKVFVTNPFSNYPTIMNILKKTNKNIIPIIGSYSLYPQNRSYMDLYNAIKQSNYSKIFPRIAHNNIIKGINDYKQMKQYGPTVLSIGVQNVDDIEYLKIVIPDDINIEVDILDQQLRNPLRKQLGNPLREYQDFINAGLSDLITDRDLNIIKIPYDISLNTIEKLYNIGFRQFHINVTPNNDPRHCLNKIEELDRYFFGELEIIVGEIFDINDQRRYRWCGAEHISIGAMCMNPFKMNKLEQYI